MHLKLPAPTVLPVLVVLVGNLLLSAGAGALTLYSEDFEGLPLGPYVSPGEWLGGGTDWTATPPAGMVLDTTTTPSQGPPEFFGWTFHEKTSWITTAGDQNRSAFTKGVGIVAVADGDEYDDLGDIDPDLMNVFMSIPLDVTGAGSTIDISFDSSFRPFGSQTGLVDVSFDGGSTFSNLLTLTAGPGLPEDSLDRVNESVTLQAVRTGDDLIVRFGLVDTGNDWWWAVDNISIDTVPEPATFTLVCVGLIALLGRSTRR